MTISLTALAPALIACGIVVGAQAADDLGQFRTTDAPSSLAGAAKSAAAPLERQNAIDGLQYAEVAPVFTGADGNVSFLRFTNGHGLMGSLAEAVTFNVSVVGSPSGTVYGVAALSIPSLASPQYPLSDILSGAGVTGFRGTDTAYALYIQAPSMTLYQHVIYNDSNKFFENVSVCGGVGGYTGSSSGDQIQVLANVHTSALSAYPAQIYLHNYQNAAATYAVQVVDARTGVSIGSVPLSVAANATYKVPESYLEQQLNWTPTASQQHANLFITKSNASSGVSLMASVFIYNTQLAAYINMTSGCAASEED